jgi:hypothetical protein
MKKIVIGLAIVLCSSIQTKAQYKLKPLKLETGFAVPPDSIQTSVYWYWISDNISKTGVIKDLEAMKKVGINRAFIGNMGLSDVPSGKAKLFSEEWWDILHTALKTATRLNIEIGIFNSPGWSQSGGPWVKPEQSMRYLDASEITVKGPIFINQLLERPQKNFQDVKVIAYPAPKDFGTIATNLKVTSDPVLPDLDKLTDNLGTSMRLPAGKVSTLNFQSAKPFTARSVIIYCAQAPAILEGEIQALSNGSYQTIRHFTIDRSNPSLPAGFKPYGRTVISIPETTTSEFRVVFTKVLGYGMIGEVQFSASPLEESYVEKTLGKMWPDPYAYWPAYQWPVQPVVADDTYLINPVKVLDISRYMAADGILRWRVPPGDWIIERTGMTPTNVTNAPATREGTGLETDKMSAVHIASHFDAFLGEIMRRIPAEDRKTWKITVADSYETGGQNWTDGQVEQFKQVYGYDPVPFLPVFRGKVVGSPDQSDRFLWDIRRFVADKVAYDYVGGLRKVSHEHGLTTWLENYGHGGFPGEFLQYGGQSDEVAGEFWSEGMTGLIENRGASSCAHIYGKNKVSCESFTCMENSFSRYPATMKQRLDRFFTEGINNTLLHVNIQQPNDDGPGLTSWFGNEFNRLNTWYFDMDTFLQYIKRCNLMLQQGKYIADVAYFISEDAPKMTGIQDPALPVGYSFDYMNAEVIRTRMSVKNDRMVLPDGMNYKVLVLPKLETMRPELLLKIKELVSEGAVVMGPRPSRSPSLQNFGKADQQVRALAAELWGNINGSTVKVNHFGKGLVIDGMSLDSALKMVNVLPDLKTLPGDSVLFIHRQSKDESIYFISNQQGKEIKINPEFRISGKAPELWDATTGQKRELTDYSQTSTTKIPLTLAPYESAFVVFRDKKVAGKKQANYAKAAQSINISNNWLVSFDAAKRGPAKPVMFKELADWSSSALDSIKYYSGPAYYRHNVNLAAGLKNKRIMLDLGALSSIAKVKVNGKEIGGVWTAPYQIDISNAVKPGENQLEIKVVNTWVNRLLGDGKISPDRKREASGLLGPVNIKIY